MYHLIRIVGDKKNHLFLFQQRIESVFSKDTQIGYKCAREKGIASSIHSLWVPSIPICFFQNDTAPPCRSVLFSCKEITSNRI